MAALYADIAAKQVRARIQQNKIGKTQYDYDSDEDTEGGDMKGKGIYPKLYELLSGTWEHKARMLEMAKTQADAEKANAAFEEGKHHIGDFLPPEELNKFMNKYKVSNQSMYSHLCF